MTISSFCREQLLAHGPLSLDDLTARAVEARVTRARDPHTGVASALRGGQVQLLDGRWVTPLWLLEGRCLTTPSLPFVLPFFDEPGPDLRLLGRLAPTRERFSIADAEDTATVVCVRVRDGEVQVSRDPATLEVAALAARLVELKPQPRYGEQRSTALRAVAQLMVDEPSSFRSPLPPLSTWVPALVEDERRREEQARRSQEWNQAYELRQARQVVLDDCTAVEVDLAAQRVGMSTRQWVLAAIDRALEADQPRTASADPVVISLGEWGR